MANRTTVKSNIVTKNVPTVTNAILTDMLNADMSDNIKFLEDVAVSQTSGTTNITVNFTGKDRVDLTRTGGALNITVSGIMDGQEVDLLITKTAGQAITFVGVTDVTPIKANVTSLNLVLYSIRRKGANYYARAWVESVLAASDAEAIAGTITNKFITPANLTAKKAASGTLGLSARAAQALVDMGAATDPGTNPIYVAPPELLNITGGVKTKKLTYSGWNMDTTAFISVNHGLTLSKILGIQATIVIATGTHNFNERISAGTTAVALTREAAGFFDSASFNNADVVILVSYEV